MSDNLESGNASVMVSLSENDPAAGSTSSSNLLQAGDYSKLEIQDPITQTTISNLGNYVETSAQLEAIHIQSPMFDPVAYLTTLHKETDSATFDRGIRLVRQKANGAVSSSLQTKKDLVINNYVQFLAAKMTLDDINRKFLSTKEISDFLDDLEEQMKQLRTKSQLKLLPLVEHLDRINDCVITQAAVRQISQILKVNRAI